MKKLFEKLAKNPREFLGIIGIFAVVVVSVGVFIYYQHDKLTQLGLKNISLQKKLDQTKKALEKLESEDQYIRNNKLEEEITNIRKTYKQAVGIYENLLKLQEQSNKTGPFEQAFSKSLVYLSDRNYASAEASLTKLSSDIKTELDTIASSFSIPKNVPVNNAPPTSGFSRQQVQTEIGNFLIDIVSAYLGSTRVIVDSASDTDCKDNCPVLSLGDYVSRSGAYAGVNGSYFCPASYPSCAGKANSFDTLLMNKNKKYINSDNNVYSSVPLVAFTSGGITFRGRSSDWGRDTGVDGVLANQPLLLSGGNIVFGGDGDPKKGSKGSRSFVGAKGNTVYIGVVHNATVAEVAYALKALGMTDALNLDSGGSTALWNSGYKVGPGRNIPNAILFVRK